MAPFGLINKVNSLNVPLKSIQIRTKLHGFTAEVVATMEYSNLGNNPIEAIYVFPLDEEAAVCGFQATIDGRIIVAEIQEKQEARDTYDDAISSGHSAFLLEESDESSDIFQINVGNLPPRQSATVKLTFVTTLTVEKEGRVVFMLPTVLNPRYSPSDTNPSVSATMPSIASVSTKYLFDFELDVQCASPIQDITSPCNRLQVDINPEDNRQAIVRLEEDYKFDADIQVHVLCSKPFEPCALVENGVTKSKDGKTNEFLSKPVVMLNFFPSFDSCSSLERGEFIFVVDRSGSMGGSKIKSAKDTLLLFLKSLPEDCFFNVIGFGSSFEKLFPKSENYNDSSLTRACSHAESMDADLGGTEILEPLRDVFSQPLIKGYPRQIFLLTDGEVSNTQQVIELVRTNVAKARCFTFGIGEGASTALVKGVARAGRGTAEFVATQDRLQPKVMKTLRNALQPALKDIKVTWSLPKTWSLETVPSASLTVFCGNELVMFGLLNRKDGQHSSKQIVAIEGKATLSGTIDDGDHFSLVEHTIKFSAVCGNPADRSLLLHRLCAKTSIRDLQEKDDTAAVLQLSKSANIVSKHTSFVAVDKQSRIPVSRPIERPTIQKMYGGRMFGFCATMPPPLPQCQAARPLATHPPPPGRAPNQAAYASMPQGVPMFDCLGSMSPSAPPPPPPPPRRYVDSYGSRLQRKAVFSSPISIKSDSPSNRVKEGYLSLISLQKASGAWQLTAELASVCGVTMDKVKQACPSQLTTDNKDSLWATAIALSCLAGKFAHQKDEWEMVAAKATKWLKAKLSTDSLSYDEIMDFASRFLAMK